MTKKTKTPVSIYCLYDDFAPAIHPDFWASLPNYIQRSRRGTFPKYFRENGKKTNPALFKRQEILDWAASMYGLLHPTSVVEMKKALGLKLPKNRKAA